MHSIPEAITKFRACANFKGDDITHPIASNWVLYEFWTYLKEILKWELRNWKKWECQKIDWVKKLWLRSLVLTFTGSDSSTSDGLLIGRILSWFLSLIQGLWYGENINSFFKSIFKSVDFVIFTKGFFKIFLSKLMDWMIFRGINEFAVVRLNRWWTLIDVGELLFCILIFQCKFIVPGT